MKIKFLKRAVLPIALACLLLAGCGREDPKDWHSVSGDGNIPPWQQNAESGGEEQQDPMPWDEFGAKQPKDYTWEEFEALTAGQQMAFQTHLGAEVFDAWLEKHQSQSEPNPWQTPGAKQPMDYTWEEFEALTAGQQMAFQIYLGSDGFDTWLVAAQSQADTNPWEKPGAKPPEDYTWEEFEALTAGQQMAFQTHLGADSFDAWLGMAQSQSDANPWEKPGAKQPADYTWEEFDALEAAQQMAFQTHLGEEGFEAWLVTVQSQTEVNPWEIPYAKQPEDYTWQEFEALTAGQQMAFQSYLGPEAFDAWLVQAEEQGEDAP